VKVTFVNRYFFPDHSATSQMASDLAFHLAARGWDVEVITSRQRYDDAAARLPASEVVNKVTIRRVRTSRFGRALLAGRAIDYATFYASAFVALLRTRGVVVAMTDPPLISVIAALTSRRLVNWIQDLFPEVAEALGVMKRAHFVRMIRDWSLRRARANVVLSESMAQRAGVHAMVRANWADEALRAVPREANPLRDEWRLGGAFVAGYSGNLGRAHEFDTIVGAMKLLASDEAIRFLIIGDGAQFDRVQRETRELPNVVFRPYQARERLSESLSAADVHLVSLQPSLEGLIVPSKFYGVLAVARPVIYIGSREGDLARLIVDHDLGFVIAPHDSEALAKALRDLASDRASATAMGARGRALYDARFAPAIALAEWERILSEAANG
jgi:glycosyltransferase involved in cell wall biosynthesis